MLNIYRDQCGNTRYRVLAHPSRNTTSSEVMQQSILVPSVLQPRQMSFDRWKASKEEILYAAGRFLEDALADAMVGETRFTMTHDAIVGAFLRYAYKTSSSARRY